MKKAICVLGGMGPQASVHMHKLLIEISASNFNAKNTDEYPEIVIFSIPVPDFIGDTRNKRAALELLKVKVRKINKLSISCIGVACNTAHLLLPNLQPISKAPFISMIGEVTKNIDQNFRKVGLLASPVTIESKLYQKTLKSKGIKVITPTKIQLVILEKIIRNVIEGKITKKDQKSLFSIAISLKKRGAQGIILGCTELPLVFPKEFSLPVFNSVEILANALLRNYYKYTTPL